jgi:ribonuclease Z
MFDRGAMRQLLESSLVNDVFGDPVLYVDLRDEARALLFDLGDIRALAPRKLLRISHVFVTHTHMDHFAGFDLLLRVVLGRQTGITLFGGPAFIAQVQHKLQAYSWNVVQRYPVTLVLDVRELGPDGACRHARFSSATGFAREDAAPLRIVGDLLHEDSLVRVRARLVDHGMPCLAYLVEEKAQLRVAKNRLAALGVSSGAWLRDLKAAVRSGAPGSTPLQLRWRDRAGAHEMVKSVAELSQLLLDKVPGLRIGYATDLRYSQANLQALSELLAGVDCLYIESVFLDAERAHAARKNHLTAREAGRIAARIGARRVVPMHFSPRYKDCPQAIVDEVNSAWHAAAASRHAIDNNPD